MAHSFGNAGVISLLPAGYKRVASLLRKTAEAAEAGLVRELELYLQAGLTNEQALQTATIVPARMTGMDNQFGSIAPGKTASMILVEGDTSKDIGALRRIATVFLDGYRLDVADLRKASGFSGMPK